MKSAACDRSKAKDSPRRHEGHEEEQTAAKSNKCLEFQNLHWVLRRWRSRHSSLLLFFVFFVPSWWIF